MERDIVDRIDSDEIILSAEVLDDTLERIAGSVAGLLLY